MGNVMQRPEALDVSRISFTRTRTRTRAAFGVSAALGLGAAALFVGVVIAHPGATTRVSVFSEEPSISADGRFVAFTSLQYNLVPGDTNNVRDVFVHDRQTATTTRVSVSTAGAQGTYESIGKPSISADGRFVAFTSAAPNLVAGDTNGGGDVFVHDRQTASTTRVSVSSAGAQATGSSLDPSVSADGRFVAFTSLATDLVPGDTNNVRDVFVHDRQTATTTRVSVSSAGAQVSGGGDPSISADGRNVAFASEATDLVAGDTNGAGDVFVHDRQTASTTRVSVSSAGAQASPNFFGDSYSPRVSGDGRFVAFSSSADNLVAGDTNAEQDVFVHDRQTASTTRVSVASAGAQASGGGSGADSVSADGRLVSFTSYATDLVAGDTNATAFNSTADVFVHDRQTASTTRVSVSSAGAQGDYGSSASSISADGRFVAFASGATNLVAGDTNSAGDVFVHDLHMLHLVDEQPFTDIDESIFIPEIAWLAHEEITFGCNVERTLFCPTVTVTREQMASFLVRAMDLPPPPPSEPNGGDYFVDDEGSIHENDINALRYAGITTGCGTDNVPGSPTIGQPIYCPSLTVTREQMATFISRARALPDPPPSEPNGGDYFTDDDDPDSVLHEPHINRLRYAGITRGCNEAGTLYCPDLPVTREQMAAFLYRALGD